MGIPSPSVVGIVNNGNLRHLFSDTCLTLYNYLKSHSFKGFAKAIDGECGNSVYVISANGKGEIILNDKIVDEKNMENVLGKRILILQKVIDNQHPSISNLHKESINTVRIVTYQTNNGCFDILPPVLRIGTGNKYVDNWAAGGIAVGIDEKTYKLKKYGFFKPGHGGKTDHHPDSGIRFEGYQVPLMQEAIDSAISFHKLLPGLKAIGWDIALTTDGPLFIEGNDNWDLSLIQACSHGLSKEFNAIYY